MEFYNEQIITLLSTIEPILFHNDDFESGTLIGQKQLRFCFSGIQVRRLENCGLAKLLSCALETVALQWSCSKAAIFSRMHRVPMQCQYQWNVIINRNPTGEIFFARSRRDCASVAVEQRSRCFSGTASPLHSIAFSSNYSTVIVPLPFLLHRWVYGSTRW